MKFDDSDRADASQVEDRRGDGGCPIGRIGVGGGLGAVIVVVLVVLRLPWESR